MFRDSKRSTRCLRWEAFVVALLLLAHVGLLAWIGLRNSPVWDELGHLPAGVNFWHFGKSDLYRVNPPLVRAVATVPVVVAKPETEWSEYRNGPGDRPEWALGLTFVEANADRILCFLRLARGACIPFCLIGAYVCWRWASELYGKAAGIVALVLWCLSPNVLAWGSTICPDAPAAALGLAACYVFWRWLQAPTWRNAIVAGVALGLAELSKTTWVVLFGTWPVLWIVWRWCPREGSHNHNWRQDLGQPAVIAIVSVYVLNLGYGFDGSFTRLEDHTFISRSLAGKDSFVEGGMGGNRFSQTWLGSLPVPFPKNYLSGIDTQKRDFEEGKWSYLRGEWKFGGWWYYYLYALAVKVPLGTWLLGILAVVLSLGRSRVPERATEPPERGVPSRPYSTGWLNEFTLLLPATIVFVLVSSQTGFNRHLRYVLPCFPFLFVWISKVAQSITLGHWKVTAIGGAALVWSISSSLWCYPHCMSYFNTLAGGPANGHAHLIDSNTAWGQDLLFFRRWSNSHSNARPLYLKYYGFINAKHYGIDCRHFVPQEFADDGAGVGPRPGWYAISVHCIHDRSKEFLYFLQSQPVAVAGYSIHVYHFTLDEANRLRGILGLPRLPGDWKGTRDQESAT